MIKLALLLEGFLGRLAIEKFEVAIAAPEPLDELLTDVFIIAPQITWRPIGNGEEQKDPRLGVKHHLFDRARVQQKRAANGELTP